MVSALLKKAWDTLRKTALSKHQQGLLFIAFIVLRVNNLRLIKKQIVNEWNIMYQFF